MRNLLRVFAIIGLAAVMWPYLPADGAGGQEKQPAPAMKEWEHDIRKRMDKDHKLKALAAKYPLVLLHSSIKYFDSKSYKQSAFSFLYETTDDKKHHNDVQIVWGNGGFQNDFYINMMVSQQNLVADLGKVDFENNPDTKRVHINDAGFGPHGTAVEGHVYLERVRDMFGNNFYVLFQIVAVDGDGRYMAFVWRRLPGGKTVKQPDPK
jgi:hypothetical protein